MPAYSDDHHQVVGSLKLGAQLQLSLLIKVLSFQLVVFCFQMVIWLQVLYSKTRLTCKRNFFRLIFWVFWFFLDECLYPQMADFVDLGIAYGKRGTSLGTSSPPTSSEQHPYLYFFVRLTRFLTKNNRFASFKILKRMLVFKLKTVILVFSYFKKSAKFNLAKL